MTQRIVDQVGDHLHEQLLVAGHRKRCVEALNQRLAFVFGSWRERLHDLPRQFGEVNRPESRPPRPSLDLSDAEQGIEGLEHTLDVADHRIDRTARRARRRFVPYDFETTQHSGQRLPQIMRNVGADLPVRLQELLDSIEQPVEGSCERRQVVVCAT